MDFTLRNQLPPNLSIAIKTTLLPRIANSVCFVQTAEEQLEQFRKVIRKLKELDFAQVLEIIKKTQELDDEKKAAHDV